MWHTVQFDTFFDKVTRLDFANHKVLKTVLSESLLGQG